MALDDRDWYRDEVKKNPKNYIYNPKQHRRSWNQHQKKPRQVLIWIFWIALLFGLFTVFKKYENHRTTPFSSLEKWGSEVRYFFEA